ncbi:hypothetical protein WJX77_005776 [Trebouxia sp. C0004]
MTRFVMRHVDAQGAVPRSQKSIEVLAGGVLLFCLMNPTASHNIETQTSCARGPFDLLCHEPQVYHSSADADYDGAAESTEAADADCTGFVTNAVCAFLCLDLDHLNAVSI